jgi:hypothetical protein
LPLTNQLRQHRAMGTKEVNACLTLLVVEAS